MAPGSVARGPCCSVRGRGASAGGAGHPGSREAAVAPGASSPPQWDRSPAAPPPQSAGTDSPRHQCARSSGRGAGPGLGAAAGRGAGEGRRGSAQPPAIGPPSRWDQTSSSEPRREPCHPSPSRQGQGDHRESRRMGRGPGSGAPHFLRRKVAKSGFK